ncbi:MAG: hypothetical protein Q9168_005141 [Polycauliona sp. 1 TL-2023]
MPSPDTSHTPVSDEDKAPPEPSTESSANHSRDSSKAPRPKNRVRFTPSTPGGGSADNAHPPPASFDARHESNPLARPAIKPLPFPRPTSLIQRSHSAADVSHPVDSNPGKDIAEASVPKQTRPSLSRASSSSDVDSSEEDDDNGLEMSSVAAGKRVHSQQTAQERGERLSRMMGSSSAPGSRTASPYRLSPLRSPPPSPPPEHQTPPPLDLDNLPLEKLHSRRTYGIEDEHEEDHNEKAESRSPKKRNPYLDAAARLVGHHTSKGKRKDRESQDHSYQVSAPPTPLRSGQVTPIREQHGRDYVPRPKEYREGFLSSILKLYDEQGAGAALSNTSVGNAVRGRRPSSASSLLPSQEKRDASPASSGVTTPKAKREKWYNNKQTASSTSLSNISSNLVHSATVLAHPGGSPATAPSSENGQHQGPKPMRPQLKSRGSSALDHVFGRSKSPKPDNSIHIQVHIAETMTRQAYLMKMCKALMMYGAPTHRLEEQMRMSARVLEIEGQFLYIPGCMIISFDDCRTHTTEVKIVRTSQAIDLGKLREVHEIYKETLHDMIGVEEAMERLDTVLLRAQRYNRWLLVLVYGCASACVGPFAFGARPIDLPIAFLLGCCLGFMQLIMAPKSELYSNIFEVTAAVLTSFLARMFGSIRGGDFVRFDPLPTIITSEPKTKLTNTTVCGALELQSRNILAGSVRMVYAIIYSLFLGYGITIGTSFYGGIDSHAISETSCRSPPPSWFPYIFVPPFTLCLIIINQGKWKQMPAMLVIAYVGYIVNHFSALRFASNAQIANTLGALAVGVLGNLYSRLRHGVAAAALLPAIFVQVPSGLAAGGSLVSGVTSANQITRNGAGGDGGVTTISNATQAASVTVNSMVFNVGYSMIQVAIGITVGLFLSALVVYPLGKRRSGLFSF